MRYVTLTERRGWRNVANGRLVAYYRVSTARQGASGLGLDAQRASVRQHLNGGDWSLVAEVVEIESGKRNDRPKLAEALRLCRLHKATLIIAKLDRLARNVAFTANLMDSGVDFVAVDFLQANRLTIHILAAVAEHEARAISKRTTKALAEAKKRGVVMGGFRGKVPTQAHRAAAVAVRQGRAAERNVDLAPILAEIRAAGATSLREIAAGLNAHSVPTARGGEWSAVQVQRVLASLAG